MPPEDDQEEKVTMDGGGGDGEGRGKAGEAAEQQEDKQQEESGSSEDDTDEEDENIPIFIMYKLERFKIKVSLDKSVDDLKKIIEDLKDIPVEEQHLCYNYNGMVLSGSTTLKECSLSHSVQVSLNRLVPGQNQPGRWGMPAVEKNKNSHENIRVFDFRSGSMPEGVKIMSTSGADTGRETTERLPGPKSDQIDDSPTKARTAGKKAPPAALTPSTPLAVDNDRGALRGDNKESPPSEQEPQWQEEQDGSSSLLLQPGTCLQVALGFQPNHGKLVNDFTITMDVCLEELPRKQQQLPLAAMAWPYFQPGSGEVLVNHHGGLGALGNFGGEEQVLETLKSSEWSRVVVTCGGVWGSRNLCTYVNGRRCTTISKSLLNQRDGRFALPCEGILLFARQEKLLSKPTIKIRLLDVRRFELTAKDVAASRYENQVFSLWKKKKEEEEKLRRSQLSLSAVLPSAIPIWQDRSFFGLFCDAFVENTDLEGGLIEPSISVMTHVVQTLFERESRKSSADIPGAEGANSAGGKSSDDLNRSCLHASKSEANLGESDKERVDLYEGLVPHSLSRLLSAVPPKALGILRSVLDVLRVCNQLCKEFDVKKGEECLIPFVARLRKQLGELEEGQCMLVPGGWRGTSGGHAVMYVIERTQPSSVAASGGGGGHQKNEKTFRFVVCNTGQGLKYHAASAQFPPKLKYKTCLAVDNISEQRLDNDVFWAILLRLMFAPSQHHKPSRLYETLLPFLAEKPLEACVAASVADDSLEWRSPQRAGMCFFRCVLEAFHYLLRRAGLGISYTKLVSFLVRYQMIVFLQRDLTCVKELRESDVRLIKMACSQLAHAAVKLSQPSIDTKEVLLAPAAVSAVQDCVMRVCRTAQRVTCLDGNSVEPPPQLDLMQPPCVPKPAAVLQVALHPFFDRFHRNGELDGLAGTPSLDEDFIPIDFLQLPKTVSTRAEAVAALRLCNRLCALLEAQGQHVKNVDFLKIALIQHVMTELIPLPKPRDQLVTVLETAESFDPCCNRPLVDRIAQRGSAACMWSRPMLYQEQIDIALLVHRLVCYFISSSFNIRHNANKYRFDAVRIVVLGVAVALMDTTIRNIATDIPSIISQVLATGFAAVGDGRHPGSSHLSAAARQRLQLQAQNSTASRRGRGAGSKMPRPKPYGLSLGCFAEQTSTLEMTDPRIAICRAGVLDYFQAQRIPRNRQIMAWETGNHPHGTTNDFISTCCAALALETEDAHIYLTGSATGRKLMDDLTFHYIELGLLRDVSLWFKFAMITDTAEQWPGSFYYFTCSNARLNWTFNANIGQYQIRGMYKNMIDCQSANNPSRHPSQASPSVLTSPDSAITEEDILHIRTLPSFKDSSTSLSVGLGQRDAELLLTYLSATYLRIPLILDLFASKDRIHALQNTKLQQILEAAIFEAGNFLPTSTVLHQGFTRAKRRQEREKKRQLSAKKEEQDSFGKKSASSARGVARSTLAGSFPEDGIPVQVPTPNRQLLATPYGLLMNELIRSPRSVVRPLTALIHSALGLDSSAMSLTTLQLLCFIVRIATRVDSYIACVVGLVAPAVLQAEGTCQIGPASQTGKVHQEPPRVILCDAARLEALAREGRGAGPKVGMRGAQMKPAEVAALVHLWRGLRWLLRFKVHPLLNKYMANPSSFVADDANEKDENAEKDDPRSRIATRNVRRASSSRMHAPKHGSGGEVEESTKVLCLLHAHRLLLFRELQGPFPITTPELGRLLASLVFLQTRHSWNGKESKSGNSGLGVSEMELAMQFQRGRRELLRRVAELPRAGLSRTMDLVFTVATSNFSSSSSSGGGSSRDGDAEESVTSGEQDGGASAVRTTQTLNSGNEKETETFAQSMQVGERGESWGFIKGERNSARYTIYDEATEHGTEGVEEGRAVGVSGEVARGVEINLQLAQMVLKTSHLQQLGGDVASSKECRAVFGKKAFQVQCARIFKAKHCTKLRIVGRDHTVSMWDADTRQCISTNTRLYEPNSLAPTEMWIIPILEPVRLDKREPWVKTFGSFHLLLPQAPLPAQATVVRLEMIHPAKGVFKEVFVHRQYRCVTLFEVTSYGRVFHRSLRYATDARYALKNMQETVPRNNRMREPWPEWERFGSGTPLNAHAPHSMDPKAESIVVARAATHPWNFSQAEEKFVPPRLLFGLLPACLLETHWFWQDSKDVIRGYPKQKKSSSQARNSSASEVEDSEDEDENDLVDGEADVDGESDRSQAVKRSQEQLHLLIISLHVTETVFCTGNKGVMAEISRRPLTALEVKLLKGRSSEEVKEVSGHVAASGSGSAGRACKGGDEPLVLLNLLYSEPGTALHSLVKLLVRLEHLSHILCWTTRGLAASLKQAGVEGMARQMAGKTLIKLVELPRLKLSFEVRSDETGSLRLYSLDYAGLSVFNGRSELTNKLLAGLPTSLLMIDDKGKLSILVPNIFPLRPVIQTCPFSTELVFLRKHKNWYKSLDSRCFLYNVHISMSFVASPTLASSLYLLWLRFAHRQYAEVFQLANGCASDTSFSEEEFQIFDALKYLNSDRHPDAHACRCKIALSCYESPDLLPWMLATELTCYLMKLPHVSASCRLSLQEEQRLLSKCLENKDGDSLMDTAGPVVLGSLRSGLFLRTYRSESRASLSASLSVSCSFEVVVLRREARDGSQGIIALRHPKSSLYLRLPQIGIASLASGKAAIPDACKLRIKYVGWSKRHKKRIITIQSVVSQKYLRVSSSNPYGPRNYVKRGKSGQQKKKGYFPSTTEKLDSSCHFLYGHSASFQLQTPHIRNRSNLLAALAIGLEYAECEADECKAGAPPHSETDEDDENNLQIWNNGQEEDEEEGQAAEEAAKLVADEEKDEEEKSENKTGGAKDKDKDKDEKSKQAEEDSAFKYPVGAWPLHSDRSALSATAADWKSLTVDYAAPQAIQGTATLRCFSCFWSRKETMSGEANSLGFLFLYQLFVGGLQVSIKSFEQRSCHAFASLALQLCKDSHKKGLLQSVLHTLSANPQVCARMPKFSDFRKFVTDVVSGSKSGAEKVAPLDDLFKVLIPALQKEMEQGNLVFPTSLETAQTLPPLETKVALKHLLPDIFPKPSPVSLADAAVAEASKTTVSGAGRRLAVMERSLRTPVLSDFRCNKRAIRPIDLQWDYRQFKENHRALAAAPGPNNTASEVTTDATQPSQESISKHKLHLVIKGKELQDLCGLPLRSIGLDRFVCELSYKELGKQMPSSQLPFNVSAHPNAKSVASQQVLARLAADMKVHAHSCATEKVPKLLGLLDKDLTCFSKDNGKGAQLAEAAMLKIESLTVELLAMRERDEAFISMAIPYITARANHVSMPTGTADGNGAEISRRLQFLLRRFCQQETKIWLSYIIGCLLSSEGVWDLQKLNPFLDEQGIQHLFCVSITVLLKSTRVGLINRCLSTAKQLSRNLTWYRGHSVAGLKPQQVAAKLAATSQQADRLARELLTRRWYVDQPHAGGGVKGEADFYCDPRFLVFEYTWEIILRRKQVDMVRDFTGMHALQARMGTPGSAEAASLGSKVKQLLMGAGKTSIISPLLGMMFADGKALVMQVVPPSLLESSRQVLRATFSTMMQKRIYTFACDRAAAVGPHMSRKLRHAVTDKAIVLSTPVAIKSCMLKLIETLGALHIFQTKRKQPKLVTQAAALTGSRVGGGDEQVAGMVGEEADGSTVAIGTIAPKQLREAASELARVLRIFQSGRLIMDEVDLILHPLRSELNFPIGRKQALDFHPLRWQLGMHILSGIFCAEAPKLLESFRQSVRAYQILQRLRVAIQKGYAQRALLSKPHLVLLNTAFYHQWIRPIAAEWAYLWLMANQLPELTAEEAALYIQHSPAPARRRPGDAVSPFGSFSDEDSDGDSDDGVPLSPPTFVRQYSRGSARTLKEVNRVVAQQLPERFRKMLNLTRDWLLSYLPHALRKINRVSFGLLSKADLARALVTDPNMPMSRAKLAVPFVGKDMPSQSSEYAHPDITIALSVLAYRYEGLRRADFLELISALRTSLNKELGPYGERKSSLLYSEWINSAGGRVQGQSQESVESPHLKQQDQTSQTKAAQGQGLDGGDSERDGKVMEEFVPLRLLRLTATDQMRALHQLWRCVPDVIHYYLDHFVFPKHLQNQVIKISANGQDLGGGMLFQQRVGFSGTPSSLLPRELGRCDYEKGADGFMIQTLTDPHVVQAQVLPEQWTVRQLLLQVAQARSPECHALIDTGALVTGLSNVQVAEYLLSHGLEGMQGVVFLDDQDRKVILVRATGRIMQLAQCGISKERRFSFYDQVHTTGVDIPQVLDGVAVQTLGKDMTYRDFSQGAFRMRGIGQGQRIVLYVVPEVLELIHRECAKAGAVNRGFTQDAQSPPAQLPSALPLIRSVSGGATRAGHTAEGADEEAVETAAQQGLLTQISAWLVTNTMRAESMQFNQLVLQNMRNVWRRNAFKGVLRHQLAVVDTVDKATREVREASGEGQDEGKALEIAASKAAIELVSLEGEAEGQANGSEERTAELVKCLAVFREDIDFDISGAVPKAVPFSQSIRREVAQFDAFLVSEEDRRVCRMIQESVDSMVHAASAATNGQASQDKDGEGGESPLLPAPPGLQRQSSAHEAILEDMGKNALNVEMVQARVQETEQEKEMVSEKEVEIEKYVDLAYRRENETAVPWHISSLLAPGDGAGCTGDAWGRGEHLFYPLSRFPPNGSPPLRFPPQLFVSSNYYDRGWVGTRRLRNTVVAMDLIPSVAAMLRGAKQLNSDNPADLATEKPNRLGDQTEEADANIETLARALEWFSGATTGETDSGIRGKGEVEREGRVAAPTVKKVLSALLGQPPTPAQWQAVMQDLVGGDGSVSVTAFGRWLQSPACPLFRAAGGRYIVCLSLAEAETLRRILHLRADAGLPLFPGGDCQVALRVVPAEGFAIMDASPGHAAALEALAATSNVGGRSGGNFSGPGPVPVLRVHACLHLPSTPALPASDASLGFFDKAAHQCLRFLDGELYYREDQLMALLRSLRGNDMAQRRGFLTDVLACRRRLRKKFAQTPIAKVLTTQTEWHALRLAALLDRIRQLLVREGLQLAEAFHLFDTDRNGLLAPPEVWGGMRFLGLSLTPQDVLQLCRALDSTQDGNVTLNEWRLGLRMTADESAAAAASAALAEAADVAGVAGAGEGRRCVAYGRELLLALQSRLFNEEKAQEAADEARAAAQAKVEAFRAQRARLQQRLAGGPNPKVNRKQGFVMYDLSRPVLPSAVQIVGAFKLAPDSDGATRLAGNQRGDQRSQRAQSMRGGILVVPPFAAATGTSQPPPIISFGPPPACGTSPPRAAAPMPPSPADHVQLGELPHAAEDKEDKLAAVTSLRRMSRLVSQLRLHHSLHIPSLGSRLDVPVPFGGNGGGRCLNLYTLSVVFSLDAIPAQNTPFVSTGSAPAYYVTKEGMVEDKAAMGKAAQNRWAMSNTNQRSLAKIKPGLWHVLSIAVDCMSNKTSIYLDGRKKNTGNNYGRGYYGSYGGRAGKDLGKLRDGEGAVKGRFQVLGMPGLSLKTVHFATSVLSPGEVRALKELLMPTNAAWACVGCDFSNTAGSSTCERCSESRKKAKDKNTWRCYQCSSVQDNSKVNCLCCGAYNRSSRKGGKWYCESCNTANHRFYAACTNCGNKKTLHGM